MPEISYSFVGIDPGITGGIVVLRGGRVDLWSMPKSEYELCGLLYSLVPTLAVLEKVHSFPKQGVVSSFTFGRGYGFIRGCLTAFEIPFREVSPAVWQKAVGISPRKKGEAQRNFKKRIQAVAQQLYPSIYVSLNVADALLIARYASTLV